MTHQAFTTIFNLILAHAIVDERFSGELSAIHGLSLNEAMVLLHLERAPRHRLTRVDLARRLHLNASTVTRMAAPLEKSGWVTREPDSRDARLAYVALSATALARIAEVRLTLEKRAEDFFRLGWSDEDLTKLAQLMARLTAGEPLGLA